MGNAQTPSRWQVDEYEWITAVPWTRPARDSLSPEDVLRVRPDQEAMRIYSPLTDTPGLFRTFGETPRTLEGIAEFARRYGMLGISERWSPTDGSGQCNGESLGRWQAHIECVQLAVGIHDGLLKGRLDDKNYGRWLALSIGLFPEAHVLPGPEDFLAKPSSDDFWETPQGNPIMQARHSVGRILTAALKGKMSPRIVPREEGFDLLMAPDSLLAAIWYQLAQSVANPKEFRLCARPGCDVWIEITRTNKGTRSSKRHCSEACRNKTHRLRAKAQELKRQGKSVRAIAKSLDTDDTTIKSWVPAAKT